jgi:PAS domain S-box-containing protein
MANEAGESKVARLRFECGSHQSMAEFVAHLAETIARDLGCDEVNVQLRRGEELFVGQFPRRSERVGSADAALFELRDGTAFFQGSQWPLPLIVNDLQRARVPGELALELAVRKVRSCGVFPLTERGQIQGVVECFFTRSYHRWKQEELSAFDELSHSVESVRTPAANSDVTGRHVSSDELRNQYRRMARYGNVVIIITDSNFRITDAFGNTEQILGIASSEMTSNPSIWDLILDPRDRGLLRRRIMRLRVERDELREEVRVIHQRSGEVRWMMLRALPQFANNGVFQGWEGFGIDVTDRRRAQEALMTQNRRLEALFEVARSLQGQTDAAIVTLKGLKALLRATGSRCGYGCFLHRERDELEVVAALGLSERYLTSMDPVLKGPSLLRFAINERKGLLIENLQEDPRAAVPLAKLEDLRCCIVMPLATDEAVFGAIVLFKKEAKSYSEADFDLVSAAAAQMTLAVRQAEMFDAERRHSESLSALYRISHELSKYRSPREIAEHAFPLLQQEFALKRGWFGVLNEQGTHIAGKSGFGPGLRRQIQELQVELSLRHDFLDEAVRSQRPVIVESGSPMECSGLNRIVQRLKLGTLVIIPLVSLGQVVGVLVVEPIVPHTFLKEGRLQLLVSMANEMATVLMSRRFESKMAEALKMRMAGLLASGVAHNFNNLLQAVMGQVSLVELQIPKDSPALEATRTITEAARRGAGLVSQLLNFASQGQSVRRNLSLNTLLAESHELYESLLSKRIELRIDAGADCPEVVADLSQIQQVLTNLLANAKDAIGDRADGSVTISTRKVRLRSGEIDPELAPGVYVRIDVRDNGVGMDVEQQARCFEPFFTTKNVDRGTGVGLSGTGLGLSAAYSIVKSHEGIITVHSLPGEGATFSIYLPVLSVRTGSAGDAVAVKSTSVTKGGALLLGLEAGVYPFVSSIFESLGYRSRGVFDLHQAIEVMRQDSSRWDFVVIDLEGFGGDAAASCRQLLSTFPDITIVACSASTREWAEALPATSRMEIIDKPLSVWSVEVALQRLSSRKAEIPKSDVDTQPR